MVLLVAAAGAGAVLYGEVLGGDDGPRTIADQVPDGVDAVAYVDASVFTDDTTQAAINRSLPVVDRSPQVVYRSVDAGIEELAAGPGVDSRGVETVMLYAKTPGNDPRNLTREGIVENGSYAGAIVHSDWNESDLVASLRESGTVEETSHRGHALYRTTFRTRVEGEVTAWVGVVDAAAGEYVVGTRPAVEDAVAVETGAKDSFDGGLRDTYERTPAGHVRVATVVPSDFIAEQIGDQVFVDPDSLELILHAGGTYYTDGDTLGGRVFLRSENGNEAEKLRLFTRGGVAAGKQQAEDPLLRSVLTDVNVSQSGTYVVLAYETTLEAVEAADRPPGSGSETTNDENATQVTRPAGVRESR